MRKQLKDATASSIFDLIGSGIPDEWTIYAGPKWYHEAQCAGLIHPLGGRTMHGGVRVVTSRRIQEGEAWAEKGDGVDVREAHAVQRYAKEWARRLGYHMARQMELEATRRGMALKDLEALSGVTIADMESEGVKVQDIAALGLAIGEEVSLSTPWRRSPLSGLDYGPLPIYLATHDEYRAMQEEIRGLRERLRIEKSHAANLEQEMGAWRKAFLATEGAEAARRVVDILGGGPLPVGAGREDER